MNWFDPNEATYVKSELLHQRKSRESEKEKMDYFNPDGSKANDASEAFLNWLAEWRVDSPIQTWPERETRSAWLLRTYNTVAEIWCAEYEVVPQEVICSAWHWDPTRKLEEAVGRTRIAQAR